MHNEFFSTVTGYLRCSLNICTPALKFLHLLPTQYPRIIANITRKKFDIIHNQNPYCSIGYIMQSNTRVMGILEKQPNIQIQRPLITRIQTRYIVWVFSICFKHTHSQKSCRHCNLQPKKRVSLLTILCPSRNKNKHMAGVLTHTKENRSPSAYPPPIYPPNTALTRNPKWVLKSSHIYII